MGWFSKKKDVLPEIKWHVPDEYHLDLTPRRGTEKSMAWDFVAPQDLVLPSTVINGAEPILVNTLVAVTLPVGYAMVLGSRSSHAAKKGVTVEAGWIDNDYRGLIRVVLYNHTLQDVIIKAGERFAQGMLMPVPEVKETVVNFYPDPEETVRGAGGFGSTGS